MRKLLIIAMALLAGGSASAAESITAEGVVSAPVSEVWKAWMTSEGLRAWLAPHADIDARVGGLMRANYDGQGKIGDADTIENQIIALEPQTMFSIKVTRAPENFPFRGSIGEMRTVVYFSQAGEGKTLLRIVGQGFPENAEGRQMRDFFKSGNEATLKQLQAHFDK